MNCVKVALFEANDDVVWTGNDGKPRCAHHPYICLVRASAIFPDANYGWDDYICARCWREEG